MLFSPVYPYMLVCKCKVVSGGWERGVKVNMSGAKKKLSGGVKCWGFFWRGAEKYVCLKSGGWGNCFGFFFPY